MTFGPLVFHVFKRREILHDPDVALDLIEGPAHGSVDAIFGDQYPPLEVVGFAERTLPQTYRLGIGKGCELVKKNDFLRSDVQILTGR